MSHRLTFDSRTDSTVLPLTERSLKMSSSNPGKAENYFKTSKHIQYSAKCSTFHNSLAIKSRNGQMWGTPQHTHTSSTSSSCCCTATGNLPMTGTVSVGLISIIGCSWFVFRKKGLTTCLPRLTTPTALLTTMALTARRFALRSLRSLRECAKRCASRQYRALIAVVDCTRLDRVII